MAKATWLRPNALSKHEVKKAERKGVTAAELETFQRQALGKGIRAAVEVFSVAVAAVLFDQKGLPQDQAVEMLESISELFDVMLEDHATLEDWRKLLTEQYGVQFVSSEF